MKIKILFLIALLICSNNASQKLREEIQIIQRNVGLLLDQEKANDQHVEKVKILKSVANGIEKILKEKKSNGASKKCIEFLIPRLKRVKRTIDDAESKKITHEVLFGLSKFECTDEYIFYIDIKIREDEIEWHKNYLTKNQGRMKKHEIESLKEKIKNLLIKLDLIQEKIKIDQVWVQKQKELEKTLEKRDIEANQDLKQEKPIQKQKEGQKDYTTSKTYTELRHPDKKFKKILIKNINKKY